MAGDFDTSDSDYAEDCQHEGMSDARGNPLRICVKCGTTLPPRPEASEAVAANSPLMSFDARDWAREFVRLNPEADECLMLAWFANALMRGYDEYAWKHPASPTPVSVDREKDSARLDWMERDHNARVFPSISNNDFGVRVESDNGSGFSANGKVREAIDAAMSNFDRTGGADNA